MNPLMEPIIVAIASRPRGYLDLLYYKGGNRFDLTPAVTSVMEMRSSEVLMLYSPLHAAEPDPVVSWPAGSYFNSMFLGNIHPNTDYRAFKCQ